jgi:hypothetical protein
MLKTTSDLLTSVNGRAFWPSTNGPYSDASILSIATEEIQGPLFTLLVESASELYANSTDITLVASQTGYRLPADAGYRLRDVTYIDGTGEENQLDIMPKDKLGMLDTVSVGRPRRFYLDGHKVHIWPKPPTSPVGQPAGQVLLAAQHAGVSGHHGVHGDSGHTHPLRSCCGLDDGVGGHVGRARGPRRPRADPAVHRDLLRGPRHHQPVECLR